MADTNLYCSFCGKSQNEVRQLIAGPSVFICNECVDLTYDIVYPDKEPRKDPGEFGVGVSINDRGMPIVLLSFTGADGVRHGQPLNPETARALGLSLRAFSTAVETHPKWDSQTVWRKNNEPVEGEVHRYIAKITENLKAYVKAASDKKAGPSWHAMATKVRAEYTEPDEPRISSDPAFAKAAMPPAEPTPKPARKKRKS